MRPPLWKRWLSYFREIHLEDVSSSLNPELHVSLVKGRCQLYTGNAIYSFEDLYSNYFKAFRTIPLRQMEIDHVLVLGLGLGSIPWMLERQFRRRYYYTAVEMDEMVVYLAQKYALSELKSSVEVILADGALFAAQSEQRFDVVAMDIFQDDDVPEKFERVDFLEDLRRLIAPSGLLMYNRLSRTVEDKKKTQAFLDGPFREVFPECTFLDLGGNWMLLNRDPSSRQINP